MFNGTHRGVFFIRWLVLAISRPNSCLSNIENGTKRRANVVKGGARGGRRDNAWLTLESHSLYVSERESSPAWRSWMPRPAARTGSSRATWTRRTRSRCSKRGARRTRHVYRARKCVTYFRRNFPSRHTRARFYLVERELEEKEILSLRLYTKITDLRIASIAGERDSNLSLSRSSLKIDLAAKIREVFSPFLYNRSIFFQA